MGTGSLDHALRKMFEQNLVSLEYRLKVKTDSKPEAEGQDPWIETSVPCVGSCD